MKLLHTKTHEILENSGRDRPQFAVFSSSLFREDGTARCCETPTGTHQAAGPICSHVARACNEANSRGLDYIWIRSLCIDKSSSADEEEAINGSFRWLQNATVCFAYLEDLSTNESAPEETTLGECAYWKDSWTLQELIASKSVEFFDRDWNHLGSKTSLELLPLISNITKIPENVLLDGQDLWTTSVALRIAWAAERHGSREEDVAYSLVGLTGVSMSCRYGEGAERAFARLQMKILKETTDGSIFAWRSDNEKEPRGLLAHSPSEFRQFVNAKGRGRQSPWIFDGLIRQTNRGLEIRSRISKLGPYFLMEIGRRGEAEATCERIGIWLREWKGVYVRINPTSIVKAPQPGAPFTLHVARYLHQRDSVAIAQQFEQETEIFSQARSPKDSFQTTPCGEDEEKPYLPSSPPSIISGVKRDKSGRPKALIESTQLGPSSPVNGPDPGTAHSPEPQSSESEYRSIIFRNGSIPRVEQGDSPRENTFPGKLTSDTTTEFQRLQPDLVQYCHNRMQQWLTAKRAILPLREASKPRKRAKIEGQDEKVEDVILEQDKDDPELIVVSQTSEDPGQTQDLEPTSDLVHEFWTANGRQSVSEYFLDHEALQAVCQDEETLTKYASLTLKNLLEIAIKHD